MHPSHTMRFADREMFAYNSYREKQQAEIARINAHPEQRMKYCFNFIEGADVEMRVKCYDAIAKYSTQLDYSEAHY
jgi:hypothetical protein